MAWEKHKVVMLPTEASLLRVEDGELVYGKKICQNTINFKCQHLYVLSNEEIRVGDWCISDLAGAKPFICTNLLYAETYNCKKIIATTDTSLSPKLHIGEIVDESYPKEFRSSILPQPSQSFIQTYIEEYNKRNIITEVLVEYELSSSFADIEILNKDFETKLKINPEDNTITIKKVKDSWNKEEITKIVLAYHMYAFYKDPKQEDYERQKYGIEKWIEENL